jgi:hypothetical protein
MVRILFAALLSVFQTPYPRCTKRNTESIVARAERVFTVYGVPPGVLLVIGYLESHLGCHPRSGGCWGAPVDRRHRGTADNAASSLRNGFAACGTWEGAVGWFRCGACRCPPLVGYDPPYAVEQIEEVYDRAGVARPEHLR